MEVRNSSEGAVFLSPKLLKPVHGSLSGSAAVNTSRLPTHICTHRNRDDIFLTSRRKTKVKLFSLNPEIGNCEPTLTLRSYEEDNS